MSVTTVTAFKCEVCDRIHEDYEDASQCCACPNCGKPKESDVFFGSGCCERCTLQINVKTSRRNIAHASRDLRTYRRFLKRDLARIAVLKGRR